MRYLISIILTLCWFGSLYAQDPTQPPLFLSEQIGEANALALKAIIISPNRRIAVINNTAYRVGEIVLGNKIVSIQSYSVQLDGVNGKITLFLAGNPIKQVTRSSK